MAEKRKTFSIVFNKGIDKASAPFEADPSRALEAVNYVYREGKVQKRYGAVDFCNVSETQYVVVDFSTEAVGTTVKTNAKNYNGIWKLTAEDGQEHIVAHIGKLLYEIKKENGEYTAVPIAAKTGLYGGYAYKCYEFENYKSTAVIGNNALYFLGGNKLMKLRFSAVSGIASLSPVEDGSETYIPTTTVSITYKNSIQGERASLDGVNLMTQWRKNELLSGTGKDPNAPDDSEKALFVYQLDAPIVSKLGSDIKKVRIRITRRK